MISRRLLSSNRSSIGVFGSASAVEYIKISFPGNAIDFGDLSVLRGYTSACSNGTYNRGVFGGGYTTTQSNVIDYITITSPGNATDFGDLTVSRLELSSCSNGTNNRGVFGGGFTMTDPDKNEMDYITITSTGNATDFGDLTVARAGLAACSNA